MRVLHVVASYLPARRYGGTIVSVHELCKALTARGHDVHVYTTSVDGDADSPVVHGEPTQVDGVTVTYFPSRLLRRIYYAPQLGHAVRRTVARFDVVHTHAIYLWPLWAAAREARRAGVPYVVSPRGMLEQALIEQRSFWMKAVAIGFLEKPTLEGAAAVHVTSRREAEEAQAFGFDLARLYELPNGVAVQDEPPSPSASVAAMVSGDPYVLFLGRVNWKKGLDRLISAMAVTTRARLIVAGYDDEGYRAALEGQARTAGIDDRVLFVDSVHGGDKAALLRSARALVLPSYSENFGNVALESMAHGRPVIVTPEVGIAEIVRRDGGGIVAEGTPDSLAAAIEAMVGDPRHADLLGARAREIAASLSWDTIAGHMASLYAEIAAPHIQAGHPS